MQLLAEVDLTEFADTMTVDLPYGRKRALEIATTLAMEPEMMLLDEPTQGMGHEDVHRVTELIKKVSAGRTILMVEHNMRSSPASATKFLFCNVVRCWPRALMLKYRKILKSWKMKLDLMY